MNVFELFAKIGLDTSEYDKGLSQSKAALSKFGGAVSKIAKVGTAAFGALATGTAAITKKAIDAYGEYEQLVGGVDTLFKQSSARVQKYAANAYQTAGLSANKYMETVTSFSASLLQSLGGNTKKAADYAHMAIVDMSDNANKMGTDMESIQNAYQGFAKQNYSMLDNLKLGYGGTSKEMGRLLQDAATLNKEFAKTAEFSIDEKGHLEAGYADIVQAIHIVQQEMGIAKTTRKEAAHTLQGSAAAVGAAWENLITGVADDNANFSKLIDNFVDSAVQASTNFVPRIEKALVGVGKLFDGLATKILPIITKEIPKILPGLIKSTFKLINALIKGFSKNSKALIKAGRKTVKIVWKEVTKGARTLLSKTSSWKGLGTKLADGFNKLLSKFDAEGAGGAASNVISGLMNFLLDVVDRVDWGEISVKIGEFIRGLKPLEIADNALVFVTNLIGSIAKSIMESGMDKPLETALGTLFMGIMFAPDVLKTFVKNNFSKLGNMVAKKISAKLGPVLASEKFHRLSAAGSKIGKVLGGAIAVAAAAYVGAQIGDAIGTQIRKKYGSKTQRSEDTYGLMKYLFGDARATVQEWKDAFTDAFLDEDSTLYKFFNALATPFKGWKMIFEELENAFKNSTIYKALSKLGIVKTSGGAGHSFGSGTTESKSTSASNSTKTVRPSRSTPESLSRPVSSSNKAPTKLSVNQNIKLKVGNKEFASAVENSESRLAWEMD